VSESSEKPAQGKPGAADPASQARFLPGNLPEPFDQRENRAQFEAAVLAYSDCLLQWLDSTASNHMSITAPAAANH